MLVVSLSALLLWPLVDLGSDAWGQGPPPAPTEDRYRFPTHADARLAVFDFIEGSYNPRRRHSALAYLSPLIF